MTKAPTPVESLVHRWKAEAESRRARGKQDPLTDVLVTCTAELEAALGADQRVELTVAEYAVKHRRAEVTVRRWCRLGRIPSRPAGRGYLIPVNAVPPVFTHAEKEAA